MDHLLHELPEDTVDTAREETRYDMESRSSRSGRSAGDDANGVFNDRSPLLQRQESQLGHLSKPPRREAASSSHTYRADSDVRNCCCCKRQEILGAAARPKSGARHLGRQHHLLGESLRQRRQESSRV
jgi:hypothetical protein